MFCTHVIQDRLELVDVDRPFTVGEQAETVAALRNTKGEPPTETGNVCPRVQGHTETIGQVGRNTEMAAASSAALEESQAACTMIALNREAQLEAMHRVLAMWHETREARPCNFVDCKPMRQAGPGEASSGLSIRACSGL